MTRSSSFARLLLSIALLVGMFAALAGPALFAAGASPSRQTADAIVVISEFRARGPLGGADELIELYNRSDNAVDIGGWSLRWSDRFGNTHPFRDFDGNEKLSAGTTLSPGQHYLVTGPDYSGAVAPNWAYVAGSITNDGGIALFDDAQNQIDAVGMDTGSAYLEGTPLAPWGATQDTNESHERKDGGSADNCVDTGDNFNDFVNGIGSNPQEKFVPSSPQNTSSPLSLCGVPIEATTTSITSQTPSSSVTGQNVRVDFRVSGGPTAPTGGTVTVNKGTAEFCSGPVVNGQGSCIGSFLSAGAKQLTASYSGFATYGASVSAPVTYQVNRANTVTTITSDLPDPSAANQQVTVKFQVAAAPPGSGHPTGDVKVVIGTSGRSCTGTLANGQGQCILTFGSPGGKTLTAAYQGDANFNTSTSSVETHTVSPGPTRTSPPPTGTSTLPSGLSVMINEIAWSGTSASANDEWIELYNNTFSAINLAGWRLTALDGEPNIHLTGMIPARGFFLLERGHDTTVSDIPADQIYTGALSDTVERLYLYNSAGSIVDYANTFKTTWVAGSVANNRSMERRGPFYDGPTTWVTNTGVYRNGKDADGDPINGTPKRANWATIVTLTPSPRPTIYPSRTLPPQPRPVINEFLPRAAFDWNQDGRVDVFDEFIEIANLGPVDVNLSGWKLDDEPNAGSDPYTLPSMVLKPGERALFYGLQTNILLSDGGDTVRLLSPTNVVFDAQTYGVVTVADQSWCRLPDLRGSWFSDCFPTPNQPNQRKGQVPSLPPGTGLEEPLCLLADTLPSDFLLAECHGFGEDMFSSLYWDRNGWWFDFPVRQNGSKWQTFVE